MRVCLFLTTGIDCVVCANRCLEEICPVEELLTKCRKNFILFATFNAHCTVHCAVEDFKITSEPQRKVGTILYLAICMISWSGAAIGAAVDAVQCACGDIMSSELIMHFSAKPRLKGGLDKIRK